MSWIESMKLNEKEILAWTDLCGQYRGLLYGT